MPPQPDRAAPPMSDDALQCFVAWCRLNPHVTDPAVVRRTFAAYEAAGSVGAAAALSTLLLPPFPPGVR